MVMFNLSSLLKRYWAAMYIYFIQHPVKAIACITFYLLPSLPNMHYVYSNSLPGTALLWTDCLCFTLVKYFS